MQFTWQEIIDRARVYMDDDHSEQDGWIATDKWMVLAQVEYAQLYRKWLRDSLMAPAPVDATFTGPSTALTGVLAIVGVAEVDSDDNPIRILEPAQQTLGFKPIHRTADAPARWWEAYGTGDNLTVELRPADTRGSYLVRYLAVPAYVTNAAATVQLPYGGDERLVLGIARRSQIKDSGRSALIQQLLDEADAEMKFTATGRDKANAPVIRAARSTPRRSFPADPRYYRWV